jgi:cobalt-zinc-cadmium efflux system membrane fusion protein
MKCPRGRSVALLLVAIFISASCGKDKQNPAAEAPPPAQVVHEQNFSVVEVDHPEQFPVTAAVEHEAVSQLVVTGTVYPDIDRNVAVISLASGRVIDIHTRLGDTVHKGQVLLRVRSDEVSGGFSDYRKAVSDELLARQRLNRAKELYAHGAMAQSDLEMAEDTEENAKITLQATSEHLRLLGNDPDHPSDVVDVVAPISGVITDQQVVAGGGVLGLSSSNPFTISDLSVVWIVCDVYENHLPDVHVGETADIRLNAYPDQVLKGTISNIGAVLDPTIRTAKVRIEVRNPGFLRIGMFATATFYGRKKEIQTAVPATAILHLHDRDWVYLESPDRKFQRVEVVSGDQLPDHMQVITSGLKPGQMVVTNALSLQNTADNE